VSNIQDPETWFHSLATHYVEAQIYFHLNQAGVLGALRGAGLPGTSVSALAARLNLDEKILGVLCDYTANVGVLIERIGSNYRISEFGERVLSRYQRVNGDQTTYNLFDVRIGAFGPVWGHLKPLLDQSITYGKELRRVGDYAADGLFKLAAPLAPNVQRVADRVSSHVVVEIGPTTGILAQLAETNRDRVYVGVDIKSKSLRDAEAHASRRGVTGIRWVLGDLFEPQQWLASLPAGPVLFFSAHFHEYLQHGRERVVGSIQRMAQHPGAAAIVMLEQPRLEPADRDAVSETRWLYSHSNVLIHHLIKNALILTDREWKQLLVDGGFSRVTLEETGGFAFTSYVGVK
jgi:hypothetical protein